MFLLSSVRTSDLLASEMGQHIFPLEKCILLLKSYDGKWKVGAEIARPRHGERNLRQVLKKTSKCYWKVMITALMNRVCEWK